MASFQVVWIIDIEADSAKEAAQRALEIQRDPESTATFFSVYRPGGAYIAGRSESFDLSGPDKA